ncbi:hypothetical protein A5731_22675 [Mycolicibacterium conceptionense]|uniref:Uncharacterized protein n=1 Tax=Mycolicibacterium conceptionense TaxID=451644 RepID=A0A1A0PN88_9MYCO|nr:hypothetical protein A5718_07865 [Mycolicibacterium conceptionense]OBE98503.1 hypothetical protein A5731_22675 [Mycolicibacterium conceptionense]OBF15034.1 hypothetical protein A5726_22915 [Mycolicibacterium conceptionense]OBF30633.1 hypothetical protein A5720_29770 [Mycolicibacterium conceptionense]OBH94980.1 hypothetical protein A5716_23470 [Mycolicibacterium conceptionense]
MDDQEGGARPFAGTRRWEAGGIEVQVYGNARRDGTVAAEVLLSAVRHYADPLTADEARRAADSLRNALYAAADHADVLTGAL